MTSWSMANDVMWHGRMTSCGMANDVMWHGRMTSCGMAEWRHVGMAKHPSWPRLDQTLCEHWGTWSGGPLFKLQGVCCKGYWNAKTENESSVNWCSFTLLSLSPPPPPPLLFLSWTGGQRQRLSSSGMSTRWQYDLGWRSEYRQWP